MKKILLFTLLICSLAKAQFQLPKVILPSPEAFSMTKYGDVPVGLFTGTMNYSIPLMELAGSKIKVPFSLEYATNGIKVDEVASRVGLGWNLRGGGVITRNIIGKPDNGVNFSRPSSTDTSSWEFYNWLKFSSATDNFNMPDEFTYSFMGQSGKFYMDDNGTIRELNKTGNKYSVTTGMNIFKVITPDGFQYEFGGAARDSSGTERLGVGEAPDLFLAPRSGYTAWYLTKITAPSGETVVFNYTSSFSIYLSGIQQTHTTTDGTVLGHLPNLFVQGSGCGNVGALVSSGQDLPAAFCVSPQTTTDVNQASVSGVRLTEVISKQGILRLYYSNREDADGEQKIDSLVLLSKTGDVRIKKIALKYNYSQALSTYNTPADISWYPQLGTSLQVTYPNLKKRLYLDEVLFVDVLNELNTQSYGFTYDGRNDLPPRLSFSQDKFGYFNGRANTIFYPDNTFVNALVGGDISNAGTREVDTAYSKKGVLTRIKYPTGGFSKISYESNYVVGASQRAYETIRTSIVAPAVSLTAATAPFHPGVPVKLIVKAYWVGTPPDPEGPALDTSVTVSIENMATNQCLAICEIPVRARDTYTAYYLNLRILETLSKETLSSIRIKLTSQHSSLGASAELIQYQEIAGTYNKPTGGLRVAAIENYTDEGKKASGKRYTYEDPTYGWSSGSLINDFQDIRDFAYIAKRVCGSDPGEFIGANYVISSSSSMGGFSNDYLSMNYKYVTEYFDADGVNGFTRNEFIIAPNELPAALTCVSVPEDEHRLTPYLIPGIPYSNTGALNGKDAVVTIYRNNDGVYSKAKEIRKYYSIDTRLYSEDKLYIGKRTVSRTYYNPLVRYLSDYDVNFYKRISSWSHLDKVVEKEFDESGNALVSNTLYEYGSTDHLQATAVKQYNSKNELIVTQKKYPQDVTATSVTIAMIGRNMINTQLEERKTTNGNPTAAQNASYGFYNGTQIELAGVQTSSFSNTFHDEFTVNNYDAAGNIAQLTAKNGIPVSYLWDWSNTYPSAEVKNAFVSSVAYTSFEADAKGSWTYDETQIAPSTDALTGNRVFQLSGSSSVVRTGLPAGTYLVTVWGKGSGTVLINGASPVKLVTRRGWSLYQREVSTATVSITGNAMIDEVRLYPKNAQMTTFSYSPQVGMTSQCDANDMVTYYEYDSFGRLQLIRDADGNIIKTLQYNYKK